MKKTYSVRTFLDPFGYPHPLELLIGQVRRVADEFGRPGIEAKVGQTNDRILRKGYFRTVWPSRRLARRFQRTVEALWGNHAITHRYRIR